MADAAFRVFIAGVLADLYICVHVCIEYTLCNAGILNSVM